MSQPLPGREVIYTLSLFPYKKDAAVASQPLPGREVIYTVRGAYRVYRVEVSTPPGSGGHLHIELDEKAEVILFVSTPPRSGGHLHRFKMTKKQVQNCLNPSQVGRSFTLEYTSIIHHWLGLNPSQVGRSFTHKMFIRVEIKDIECLNPSQVGRSFTHNNQSQEDYHDYVCLNPSQVGRSFTRSWSSRSFRLRKMPVSTPPRSGGHLHTVSLESGTKLEECLNPSQVGRSFTLNSLDSFSLPI